MTVPAAAKSDGIAHLVSERGSEDKRPFPRRRLISQLPPEVHLPARESAGLERKQPLDGRQTKQLARRASLATVVARANASWER